MGAWGGGGHANADERFKKGETFKDKTLTKGGGGVQINEKNTYVILQRPLRNPSHLMCCKWCVARASFGLCSKSLPQSILYFDVLKKLRSVRLKVSTYIIRY